MTLRDGMTMALLSCMCSMFVNNGYVALNLLKTSPEYTRAGVYGKCVL